MADGQGMAQRDQIGRFFGGHNAGYSRYSQNVAFGVAACGDQLKGFWLHGNAAFGDSQPCRGRFLADIHHVRGAGFVEMGEFAHLFNSI